MNARKVLNTYLLRPSSVTNEIIKFVALQANYNKMLAFLVWPTGQVCSLESALQLANVQF